MMREPMRLSGGDDLHPISEDGIRAAVNRRMRDFWLDVADGGGPPAWRAFDPISMREVLPDVVVVDVLEEPPGFRYRVIGTNVVKIAGRDATGRMLDAELYGDRLEQMIWTFRRCADSGAPLATIGRVHFAEREWITLEHLFLPFTRYGRRLDTILSSLAVLDGDRRLEGTDRRTEIVLDWRR
jgi:hypothetical protein